MLNRYRWWMIILHGILFFICYLLFFSPQWHKYKSITDKKNLLTQQLQQARNKRRSLATLEMTNSQSDRGRAPAMFEMTNPQSDQLKLILIHAQQYSLQILSINVIDPPALPHAMTYEMKILGEFSGFIRFFQQINNERIAVVMTGSQFDLDEHSRLIFHAWFTIANDDVSTNTFFPLRLPNNLHNPFCSTSSLMSTTLSQIENLLKSTPIHLLRMAGYMTDGIQRKGILLLPEGMIFAVTIHDVIGREQAVVQDIFAEKVVVELPNHHKKEIKI